MIRASAYPTVEWLHARAGDRAPVASRHLAPARSRPSARRQPPASRAAFIESVAGRLRGVASPGVTVREEQWVTTPEGEQPVDIVIRCRDRSVGILVDRRYERDTETLDALRLVYGHFDVLYRVSLYAGATVIDDLVRAVVCEKRNWFTPAGRVHERNCAMNSGLRGGRPGRVPSVDLPGVRRMRLSRANEWVRAFERALAPGKAARERHGRDSTEGHSEGHSEQD